MADKEKKKSRKWLVKLIAVLVVIAALAGVYFAAGDYIRDKLGLNGPTITSIEDLKPDEVMGFKKYVNEAVLGEAREKQDLVVWEQDVTVDTELTSALLNLGIFEKSKIIHTMGTGVYTVDMSKISEASITLDVKAKTVTLAIPHTQLQYIQIDANNTTFEDTQHALLGFGDIKMTQEQQGIVNVEIQNAMRTQLTSDECFADADEAALLMVYETYQPIIEKLAPDLFLNVVFADELPNLDVSAEEPAGATSNTTSANGTTLNSSSNATNATKE